MSHGEQIRFRAHDEPPDHAAPDHCGSPAVRAAWSTTLILLLPPAPARILAVGGVTEFLSVTLARQGYEVTVFDPHAERAQAGEAFDVVVAQDVLRAMPDPTAALFAWLDLAPVGRLVLFEDLWIGPGHPVEEARASRRALLSRMREATPGNQSAGTTEAQAVRTTPEQLAALVNAAGWVPAQVHRLTDVEWAHTQELPPLERTYGVAPRFGIVADATRATDP